MSVDRHATGADMGVYLDHAATTPLRPEALNAWISAQEVLGNASSIHRDGQAARRLLEEARERLAAVIGCDPIEVVFTSGGTEAINLALKGLWWGRAEGTDSVVLPDAEHHATLDTVEWLERAEGAVVRAVPVDERARIDVTLFAAALDGAALATALVANNEAGTLNDARVLADTAADAGVPLHLDAVSAFGHVPLSYRALRSDAAPAAGLVALSVSAHKVGGPVGVGALVVSRTARLSPLLHGGAQQRRLRAGTQDVAGASAFAAAAEATVSELEAETERRRGLRDTLAAGILSSVDGAELLGDPIDRLPDNVHVHFPGAAGETLLFLLDTAGISVSTGSACQAGVPEPSHVVQAMGRSAVEAREVLRFSLGRSTTVDDIDRVVSVLPGIVQRARAAR